MNDSAALADLLLFFDQCPVGLLEIDDRGRVRKINPAAGRILAPALKGDEDLTELFPLLRRLAPGLARVIESEPTRMGSLDTGRRVLIPGGASGEDSAELLPVRVDDDRVLVALIDVSAERRLAQREHDIAVALQRSMLGRIDSAPDVPVGVTYRAAELSQQVGGDWYDLIALPDDRLGLVVGDVVGHSLDAAVAMGQLRNAVRGMAPLCLDPGELLTRISGYAEDVDSAACTTMAYGVLERRTGMFSYACAGHPPPLLVRADGTAGYLEDGRGLPLACGWPVDAGAGREQLAVGDTVLLFTDGLFERRGDDPGERLDRLARHAAARHGSPTEGLGDLLAADMLDGLEPQDDLCVLAVQHTPPTTVRTAAGIAQLRQAVPGRGAAAAGISGPG